MLIFVLVCILFLPASLEAQQGPSTVIVDKKGVLRYTDTKEEASFFGVNYTVPFAHAYRALGYLGKDRKDAIDKDVYHFARLGFNAYRIHIWDVEISDEKGTLIENDHLDLLDYLIYKLKERDIKIVITAMTNFGNGYPERNQLTGGFTYKYGKCDIHDNQEAILAQEKYIAELVKHMNPYTNTAYMNDEDIVGFEINNEPCHQGTQEQTRTYINRMLKAVEKTGNKKPLFYNVSHNMQQIEAYYSTAIQGTTYQWYPIGLVAGHTRRGNFLPYVDKYYIPFNDVKGFDKKAKLVYEYDPADILYSYIHPAMVRSFRSAGFQWITQFAYDPIDMAPYNSEYQTHYLNLAYTPQKAVSMKIASEVARTVPMYQEYGTYPADTLFGDFRVSYKHDLSEMNRSDKFYYSNHTASQPVAPEKLVSIAGYGNSPVVKYEGTGVYFLDKLEEGLWRLEIMPDAVTIADPFAKPSLTKEVVSILWNQWDMRISLPGLQDNFSVSALGETTKYVDKQADGEIIRSVTPGVYLLKRNGYTPVNEWSKDTRWKNIRLGEYVAPAAHTFRYYVNHQPAKVIESNKPRTIEAQIIGPDFPDSVLVYTDKVSFWREENQSYVMKRKQGYNYEVVIPADEIDKSDFRYNIIVCSNGQNYTFPGGVEANPLDWDYTSSEYWSSEVVDTTAPMELFRVTDEWSGLESYSMPESGNIKREIKRTGGEEHTLKFSFDPEEDSSRFFLHKYIKDEVGNRTDRLVRCENICLHIRQIEQEFQIGFVTGDGFTYTAAVRPETGIVKIPLSSLTQTETAILPHPYPVFLEKYFRPEVNIPFDIRNIEKVELSSKIKDTGTFVIEVGSIWLE